MSSDRKDAPQPIDLENLVKFLNSNLDFYAMSEGAKAFRQIYKEKFPKEYKNIQWENWRVQHGTTNEGTPTFDLVYNIPRSRHAPKKGSYQQYMQDGLFPQLARDFGIVGDDITNRAGMTASQKLNSMAGISKHHGGDSPAALFLYLQKAVNETKLSEQEKASMIAAFKDFCQSISKDDSKNLAPDAIIIHKLDTDILRKLDKLAKASVLRKQFDDAPTTSGVLFTGQVFGHRGHLSVQQDRGKFPTSPIPKEAHGTLTREHWDQIQAETMTLVDQASTLDQFADAVKYFIDRILPLDKKTNGILTPPNHELDEKVVNQLFDTYRKDGPSGVLSFLMANDQNNIYYAISQLMMSKSAEQFKKSITGYYGVQGLPSKAKVGHREGKAEFGFDTSGNSFAQSGQGLFQKPAEIKLSPIPSPAPGTLTPEYWQQIRDEALNLASKVNTSTAVLYLIERILPVDDKKIGVLRSLTQELDEKMVDTAMTIYRNQGRAAAVDLLAENGGQEAFGRIYTLMNDCVSVNAFKTYLARMENEPALQPRTKPTMGPPGSS